MLHRYVCLVAVLAVMLLMGQAVVAADDSHEGIVVKAGDGKLTMTDKDGKNEHMHKVAAETKITCDGKPCKLEDLKEGFQVKVTLKPDKTVGTIEAKSKK